jgi:hypothetical protein
MFGDILQCGTIFDWISPLLSIAGDLVNGDNHTFLIPQECGWTGHEIANLLRSNGIKTWGHMIVNGTIMISVRQPQAAYSQYLLQRAGLPNGVEPVTQSRERPGRVSAWLPRRNSESLRDLLRDIGNIRL